MQYAFELSATVLHQLSSALVDEYENYGSLEKRFRRVTLAIKM